jgi:hypothetical protein
MHCYLTKVHGGRYLLTRLAPIVRTIRGTQTLDAFSQPGEPLDVRHLCEPGVVAMLGHTLEPLMPTKIKLSAVVCHDGNTICPADAPCECRAKLEAALNQP